MSLSCYMLYNDISSIFVIFIFLLFSLILSDYVYVSHDRNSTRGRKLFALSSIVIYCKFRKIIRLSSMRYFSIVNFDDGLLNLEALRGGGGLQ